MAYAERNKKTGKPTGRWVADAVKDNGNGTSTRLHKAYAGMSKQQVEAIEAYFRVTGEVPANVADGPANSFAKAAERFKKYNPVWLKNESCEQRLDFAITYLGKFDVKTIGKTELIDFVSEVKKRAGRGKPPANRTINRYLDAVCVVLRDCFERREIPAMPVVPRAANTGKKRGIISVHGENLVCNRLVSEGKEVEAFLVRVLVSTGMRAGELYKLRATQIELPAEDVMCGWQLERDQVKTDGSVRWVPMTREHAARLKELIANGRMPNQAQLAYFFKTACIKSGESPALSIHCLRHTFKSRLEDVHEKTLDVLILMGHSNSGVSAGYYHPSREKLYGIAKKVHTLSGEIGKKSEVVAFPSEQNQAFAKRA